MTIINAKKNKVASSVSLALMPLIMGLAFNSYAAETVNEKASAKKKKDEIEVIEVTSFRDSITSSLNTKRTANSVVDSISADDIGSFPDDNVAESLQRIAGVSITRSLSGDGEGVSIRGFGPGKNLTLVNGQQMVSSGFNLENALNRGQNFGLLPSSIVKRSDVYKSSEAHLPDGGVGGTINIVTHKPLGQKKDFVGNVSAKAQYNTLSEDTSPNFSGLASWKVNEKFGALVSLDYSDKQTRRDAVEILRYDKKTFTTANGETYTDVLVPGAIGSANFNQTRERKTAMVTLQYLPTDSVDMDFNYINSVLEGNNFNTNLISLNHAAYFNKTYNTGGVVDADYNEALNTITKIEYDAPIQGNRKAAGQVSALARDTKLESEAYQYNIKWLGDDLTLSGSLGYSESSGGAGDVNVLTINLMGSSVVGIDDGVGYVQYLDEQSGKLGEGAAFGHTRNIKSTDNDNAYFALDGEYFTEGFITSVQFGAKYTEASQRNRWIKNPNDFHLATDEHPKYRGQLAGDIGTLSSTPDGFLADISSNAISSYSYLHPNIVKDLNITYNPINHAGNNWDVEEDIFALYTQANFEHDFDSFTLRGNAGLRYSDQTATVSNFTSGGEEGGGFTPEELANLDFNSVNKGESDYLLPSINLIFDLGENWVVRSAFSTVISRPAYGHLAKQLVLSTSEDPDGGVSRRGSRGNPDLEAFEADKYDLSAEWYYKEGSSLSAGYFFYDVKTFVSNETTKETHFGLEYDISRPVNVGGGSIQGVELAFSHQFTELPAPFDGLGTQLNYTYVDSDSKDVDPTSGEELPLAGLSENTYNATLFYSKEQWDVRVSYNYRDAYFEELEFDLPRFNEEIGRLTAKIKYKFDNGLSAYIQGTNLTNQQNQRYIGDPGRPFQTSEVGRNYVVGVDYKF